MSLLHGSYALGLLDAEDKDTIYVAKNKSPLLLGVGEGFNVIASDALAMLQVTSEYKEIHDHEIVIVKKDEVIIKDADGNVVERDSYIAEIDASDAEKGVYAHYMLKEIHEQPAVMRRIIQEYQDAEGNLKIDQDIINDVKEADRIYVIAAGTSYHAGLVGKEFLENGLVYQLKYTLHQSLSTTCHYYLKNHCSFIFLNQVKLQIAAPY